MSTLSSHWEARRKEAAVLRATGSVKFTFQQGRLQVICPDSDEFTRRAKEIGGTWRDRSLCWSFRLGSQRLVKSLVIECFGEGSIVTNV